MSDVIISYEKHPGGRPRKYETPEIMKQKIDEYFVSCNENGKVPTVIGLCNFLDIDRATLIRYEDYSDEFCNVIKKAKAEIEDAYVQTAIMSKNPAGVIFILKNHFGYVDKQEIDMGISQKPVDLTGLSEEELKRLANMQMQALPEGTEEAE